MNDTDQQLLDAARAGDRRALEALLERQQARIYRFGMKLCRDPEDAKDVLQDTLIAMARGIRDFQGASSMSTWLYTIARSYCIKKHRKSKFAPTQEHSLDAVESRESDTLRDAALHPDEELARKEIGLALEQAIAVLEPGHREVFVLRDLEGLTASEVAEIVGISVAAVKSRLHRARLAVRANLLPALGIAQDPVPAEGSTCPDVLTTFSRHLEDEISPSVCAAMEAHLDTCARCRDTCDSLKRTLSLCSASNTMQVPPSVQASVRNELRKLLNELT